MKNSISVIITTRNRYENLVRCIKSVANSAKIPDQLIIVDDCSNDRTSKMCKKNLCSIKGLENTNINVIHCSENVKMVKARNIGARASKCDYCLFIDDDNVIDKNMIEQLATFFDEHTEYGVIGPAMFHLDSRKKYLDYQTFNFFTGKTDGYVESDSKEFYDTDGVPNVFMIRKSIFENIGYFDEKLIQTFTEPDFFFSIRLHGYRSALVSSAITYHDIPSKVGPRSIGGTFNQKAYCTMRNRAFVISKYGRWFHKFIYAIFFSWFWPIAYSCIALRFNRIDLLKFYWSGWWDGFIYIFTNKLRNSLPKLMDS